MRADQPPAPGTVADLVITHLQQQPEGTRLGLDEISALTGTPRKQVTASLARVLRLQLLKAARVGRANVFFLPPAGEASPSPDSQLHMAFYSADDDLSVKGMQIDGDTAVFTRDQLQQLVDFVTRPHVRPSSND